MTTFARHATTFVAAASALALAACEGGRPPPEQIDREEAGRERLGTIGDIPGLLNEEGRRGDGLTPVNRYLWRASLDTLAFLPLASTDPFTGVVATDWGASPDTPQERFKVTAYVTSPTLAANSLQVAVFREIRSPEGAWVTAPVSGSTARRLEDAILVRARQLKIDEREAAG